MNLTEEQTEILNNANLINTYISAGPGSGKSTLLSLVVNKILVEKNNSVLLCTFTNKAAKSIVDKCEGSDQERILGGTFHGISYRLMRVAGNEKYICDEAKKRLIIKKTFAIKGDKDKFERLYDSISQMKSKYPLPCSTTLDKYQAELNKYNLMDFDDIIYEAIETEYGMPKVTHILVDELQDTSGPQLELLKHWQKKTNALMIGVADDDQCYKFGSKTTIIDKSGDKKIINVEDVRIGDMIKSHKGGKIIYLPISNKSISAKKCITIKTKTKSLGTTPEHKWFVKKPNKDKNICYLMWKKDYGFRIGTSNYFSIVERMRSEKSHKVWILSEHDSKYEAEINEKILSLKYQVPVQTFIKHNYDQYDYRPVFEIYGSNGFNVLKDNNLRFDYPFQIASSSRRDGVINITITLDGKGGSNYIRLESYELDKIKLKSIKLNKKNATTGRILISSFKDTMTKCSEICEELNSLGFETNVIQKLNYNNEKYDVLTANQVKIGSKILVESDGILVEDEVTSIEDIGPCMVVDLEVKQSGRLIVDEILSHNSIYCWRGARPENVRDFIDTFQCRVFNMGYNFRSAKTIVETSRSLIENNVERIEKQIRPFRKEEGTVTVYRCCSPYEEIDYVISKCKQHRNRETAILYRNRSFKNHLEFELRKAGLQYTVNDFLEITDRSAIKVMLSVLKICAREFDVYDLQNAAKAIKRFGNATVSKIEADSRLGEPASRIFYYHSIDPKRRGRIKSLLDLQEFFDANENKNLELLVREIEKYFNKSFDYNEDMRSFLIDVARDYKITAGSIKRLNNELGLNGKEEHNDEGALIELSTVHGYKGLERDIVILPWCDTYLEPKPGKIIKEEEERRLFYVAATRAKDKLFMCHSGVKPKFIKEMKC